MEWEMDVVQAAVGTSCHVGRVRRANAKRQRRKQYPIISAVEHKQPGSHQDKGGMTVGRRVCTDRSSLPLPSPPEPPTSPTRSPSLLTRWCMHTLWVPGPRSATEAEAGEAVSPAGCRRMPPSSQLLSSTWWWWWWGGGGGSKCV